ncbi:tyrosine-type recombinase/integrase [Limimaricola cinnabarinus]|uniref:tyrosine-type recombinase/integrase n=1 Tax=Limimaricola cinnabarinus TaxID=1125964 RepID=UPI0024900CA1|nr:tyrosine-type recombinase/integrase [Limimaricola cinnabarinus]
MKVSKGREYHYYRLVTKADGKRKDRYVRIKADPGTAEYDSIYWAIRSGKHEAAPSRTNFAALIDNYTRSRRFTKLADRTRRSYRAILDEIREKNGARDVTKVTRSQVEAIHEKHAATPRKADWYVQVLSILFSHAVRLEWMKHNPAKGIELFGSQREFKLWPEWMQRAYVERAEGHALTAFYLAAGTGQRPGDLPRMEWAHFDGEYMEVEQEKRGNRLTIYCPKRLRDHLATLPRNGKFILAKSLHQSVGYNALEKAFRAVRDAIAEDVPEAKEYSLHGLRYVAAVELAEAGCSDAEIQSVTGHRTAAMVAKYRDKASRKKLSKAAQMRREQNR